MNIFINLWCVELVLGLFLLFTSSGRFVRQGAWRPTSLAGTISSSLAGTIQVPARDVGLLARSLSTAEYSSTIRWAQNRAPEKVAANNYGNDVSSYNALPTSTLLYSTQN